MTVTRPLKQVLISNNVDISQGSVLIHCAAGISRVYFP